MKYRKKPVTVDAFQLGVDSFPNWFIDRVDKGEVILNEGPSALINTLEGVMHAGVNDFIIMGVAGEIYPCKPDIFMETYEPVKEATRVTKRELLERMRKINAERRRRLAGKGSE